MGPEPHPLAADEGEYLAAGWEDDIPSDDSLLLATVRNHADQVRAMATLPGVDLLDVPGVAAATRGLAEPMTNVAVLTVPPTAAGVVDALGALDEFAGARPGVPFLLFAPYGTADLRPRGYAPVGHPPLMLRPPGGDGPGTPEGVRVDPVGAEDLATWERTVIESYPLAGLEAADAGRVLGPGLLDTGWRLWLARDRDGAPLGTSASFVGHGMQVLEYVAVAEAGRGRGVGAALTWAATVGEPDLPAVLVASDLGRPVYERLGYQALLRIAVWIVTG